MTTPTTDEPVEFVAAYDGEALREHSIPVRDLAPALLGLSESFDRANALLNGGRAALSLEVKAHDTGSFEIVMILKQVAEQAASFFAGDVISSAANIKELFFGGGWYLGLFGLAKRARGRPVEVGEEDDEGNVLIEIDGLHLDRLRLRVPAKVVALFLDASVRRALNEVVQPLNKNGISTLQFRDGAIPLETIEESDVPSFRPPVAEVDGTKVSEVVIPSLALRPEMVRFQQGKKWRFNDGGRSHFYTISDPEFSKQVLEGRKFGSADLLICQVRIVQYIDRAGTLKTDYEIVQVLEQSSLSQGLSRATQPRLPESEP